MPDKFQRSILESGGLDRLRDVVTQLGIERPFLVADPFACAVASTRAKLDRQLNALTCLEFSDFTANPTVDVVRSAWRRCRDHRADGVIAMGGGTAIDIAKLVASFAAQATSLDDVLAGVAKIQPESLPVIAIPTTAGTGSEATSFAVLYVGKTKHSIGHPQMLPDVAVVDSTLTESCPPKLTACAGLDALCQAIESYWSIGATTESRDYASKAALALRRNIEPAVNKPTPEIRREMAEAAYWTGKAINISKTTAPHAISYALTIRYGIPHGHAVALTIGEVFAANFAAQNDEIVLPGGRDQLHAILKSIMQILEQPNVHAARERLKQILAALGLQTRLRELGVPRADLPVIAAAADPARLANNPVRLTTPKIHELLERIW